MTPVEQQFKVFQEYENKAILEKLPDGTHLITVADVPLPSGWSKTSTAVLFIAPVGYPVSCPDCFWTDPDLRLANGNLPQNTGQTPIPNHAAPHHWFSWHLASWNPNSDNLLTYFYVIKRRLQDPR